MSLITLKNQSHKVDFEFDSIKVLNSCPGTCHSIDIESEVVTNWFHTRLGQFHSECQSQHKKKILAMKADTHPMVVQADVVPCGYLSQGITIQYRQITNDPNDFRVNFRLNSGALKLVEVSLGKHTWLPLIKPNPDQYTLADYSKSSQVLSQSKFSLRFTNHKGEIVVANNVPNRVRRSGFGLWYKTNVNFKHT